MCCVKEKCLPEITPACAMWEAGLGAGLEENHLPAPIVLFCFSPVRLVLSLFHDLAYHSCINTMKRGQDKL